MQNIEPSSKSARVREERGAGGRVGTSQKFCGGGDVVHAEATASPESCSWCCADTSDSAMNRLLLKNRPERSEAMSKPPGDVIEHKVVSSREQFLTLNPKP